MLHDDAQLVAVDKAAGVLTVPTAKREKNALIDQLRRHLRCELHVVHRLDRDTSGVLVFAKDRRTLDALVEGWALHERIYAAIAHGSVARDEGRMESRLVTAKNLDRRSARGGEEGERAVTHYRVIERVNGATALDVTLETGRRNQIRVHLRELGHPLLGDERYARDVRAHPLWRGGLALHARTLSFVHPATRQRLVLDAGIPLAFTRFLAAARARTATVPRDRARSARSRAR
ncbi:MAG TPA: RluA family pseudouridine synthase [Myxococcota bacterium]